ncbi:hypothetical protein AGOR_G00140190 [Albula goreensis]|uniref:Uncharacterized protein n=1 Tax=Albula goreensis TaxID=1534307 RepID=A0A8T3DA83_9TELE|nr:hypothetical protein AGOR_G00140190 [Albula goreensis]
MIISPKETLMGKYRKERNTRSEIKIRTQRYTAHLINGGETNISVQSGLPPLLFVADNVISPKDTGGSSPRDPQPASLVLGKGDTLLAAGPRD